LLSHTDHEVYVTAVKLLNEKFDYKEEEKGFKKNDDADLIDDEDEDAELEFVI
jgi:hypothetical protein